MSFFVSQCECVSESEEIPGEAKSNQMLRLIELELLIYVYIILLLS